MDIRLDSQRIKHFKGITNFSFKINGQNANICGDNGTGKTTQFDAFLWLLFGKDSTDRSTFKIKPQDAAGNDIHNLQTEVEVELLIDGRLLKLKKMQEEKWTQKRGSADKELTGNTISYWWDEEPVKEGEYKKRICELIDENIFRMITNPMYFNTKVDWKDRRKILLEICGDKSDIEVIASDTKLAKLTGILGGKPIDTYKSIVADKLKSLNKERADIPPRIDELMLTIPKEQQDYSAVEAELRGLQDIMAGIEMDMTNATNAANDYRRRQQELYGLQGKQQKVKARIDEEAGAGKKKLVDEKSKLLGEKYQLEASKGDAGRQIIFTENALKDNAAMREQLLTEYKQRKNELAEIISWKFEKPTEDSLSCPTCGQNLPKDVRNGKLDELLTKFEKDKRSAIASKESAIEHNTNRGKAIKQNSETLQQNIENFKETIEKATSRLFEIDIRIKWIDEILSAPEAAPNYEDDIEYTSLQQQIEAIQSELEKSVEDTTANLLQNKREIQDKIDACNKVLNGKETIESTKKRIAELKADEKRLANQITELEGHKYLLDQFIVAKVNLLESTINSRFKYVKFKMFSKQINGGIEECCEALIDGVPFSDANHASKVNAGLDIINTLCGYYGVTAPIYIDFRESVTKIIDTNSQVINLIKNESDKTLRVEVLK